MAGMRRAAVIGTAAFVVTAAAVVLLAAWSHQPWPPALASALILIPGLYLAAKAVPASARQGRSRKAAGWNPVDLGVHQAAGGGPLPVYVRRPHDDLLDTVLDPAVAGSRLVVIRGSSSTGKTRAAYEAVTRGGLATWRLEYPQGAAMLTALLEPGVPPRTIVWLDELRHYTSGDDGGADALGRLARLIDAGQQVIVVTTMWPEHWDKYADAARAKDDLSQDRHGAAWLLLRRLPVLTGHPPARIAPARGGVIDVPAAFTAAEAAAAASSSDPVLAGAAEAAARPSRAHRPVPGRGP